MQFAQECTDKVVSNSNASEMLNHVRLRKEVFLPVELVGGSGYKETDAFKESTKSSQIGWIFYRNKISTPTKKAFAE